MGCSGLYVRRASCWLDNKTTRRFITYNWLSCVKLSVWIPIGPPYSDVLSVVSLDSLNKKSFSLIILLYRQVSCWPSSGESYLGNLDYSKDKRVSGVPWQQLPFHLIAQLCKGIENGNHPATAHQPHCSVSHTPGWMIILEKNDIN